VLLRCKQYGEYQLSVLNDRQEFMQIILTNGDMRRVPTLRSKRYGEYRLSAINDSGESIKETCEHLFEFGAKFEKSLNTE
jgi:hypothetical protein